MAHFAEIDEDDKVVRVITIANDKENDAENFIKNELGFNGKWIKTSYNTRGGVYYDSETNQPHEDQSKAFRKNYAGIGYSYDEQRDAFIPPKMHPSWILDEETCNWIAPIPMPTTVGAFYSWNEELGNWEVSGILEPIFNEPINE